MGTDSASATSIEYEGQPGVLLRTGDGSRATVLLHGAHLISWVPADGAERLFLSSRAAFSDGQAIRGGVPVIFPQFERLGPDRKVPRHGLARTRPWRLVHSGQRADAVYATLSLGDDEGTRTAWPHRFRLELTITLAQRHLDLSLVVVNTDSEPFDFTAALHTYLRVGAIERASVEGLNGLHYRDSAAIEAHALRTSTPPNLDVGDPATWPTETAPVLRFDGEVDRIYFDTKALLRVRETVAPAAAPGSPGAAADPDRDDASARFAAALDVSIDGFEDSVVWNPGAAKTAGLADMPNDGYRHMVCVEAARVGHPVRLPAGQRWSGRQTLHTAVPDLPLRTAGG